MEFYRYVLHDVSETQLGFCHPRIQIDLQIYLLEKETPKGYWIDQQGWFNKHWIPKTSRKRFAYPTKEEAWDNFTRRIQKRLRINEHQVSICKLAIEEIKEGIK